VSGYQTLSADDPIVAIVRAGDLYTTMSHTKVISLHAPSPLLFNNFGRCDSTRSPDSYIYALEC
jgi:hypothetical protein